MQARTWLAIRALGLARADAPVQKQIDLKLYGFYIGDLEVPVAQVDVPIRTAKFLTVTPSYMYYSVPASGLNKLPPQPGSFTDSYKEHQFRIDGTVTFAIRKLRDFRPQHVCQKVSSNSRRRYQSLSWSDCDRASPRVQGRIWKPFASYETYYERARAGGTEIDLDWRHAATEEARVRFSLPTCGKPVKAVETSTTCCLA